MALYPKTKNKQKGKEQRRNVCCTCKKSHCLKLYCDCFSRGLVCEGCNCIECRNTDASNLERLHAIDTTKVRRDDAFQPKIISSVENGEQVHSKGCKCKKSGCSKKYCECYQNGIKCSEHCMCKDCCNS